MARINLQNKIVELVTERLNNTTGETAFVPVNYFYDSESSSFTSMETNPNNKYAEVEKSFIPVEFGGTYSSIDSASFVHDENGSIPLTFAVYADENFAGIIDRLDEFRRSLAGASNSFTEDGITFNVTWAGNSIDKDKSTLTLNGQRVIFVTTSVNYRMFNINCGTNNQYYLRLHGEESYMELNALTRTQSIGNSLNSAQPFGATRMSSTVGSSAWQATIVVYDTDTVFTGILHGCLAGTIDVNQVYDYKIVFGGNHRPDIVKSIVIESVSYIDAIGAPIAWTVAIKEANLTLLEE